MPIDHADTEDSVAAFALGALEPDEASVVSTHLQGCASCREVASRLARTVAVLPLSSELTTPPERLRARILDSAAAGRPNAVETARRPHRRVTPPVVRRLPRQIPTWAAVSVVAAIAAFALGVGIGQFGRSAPPPSASRFTLHGTGKLSGAEARVVSLHQDSVVLVEFSGMPQAGPGKVYELWIIPAGGQPEAEGVFTPDPDGSKVVVLSQTLHGPGVLAVTSEPAPSGSSEPTEQPSMSGNVA